MVVVLDNANFFFFFLIVKKILLTKKLLHTTRMKQIKKYVQKKKKQHKGNHANVIMLIKFNELSKFSVGDDNQICFCHDWLCGDSSLKDVFPKLYRIAVDKDVSISSFLCGTHNWNPKFWRG